MSDEPEVLIRVEGQVGRITLNRPQALHALTTTMCKQMIRALIAWRDDPGVELVLIDHTGDRGFCAGGDIRTLAESARLGGAAGREFFFTEYRLNSLLFHYAKHVVAIMDGAVMGGGVGISWPARFRVGTERTLFAMPETGIGLFPDVGGSWRLSRLRGAVGRWLGLTGARLKAADAFYLGVINHYVPSQHLEGLKAQVCRRPEEVRSLLRACSETPGSPSLPDREAAIDRTFCGESLEQIIRQLEAEGTEWAIQQVAALRAKSPLSLKVTHRQLTLGARILSFDDVMRMEYRIACRLFAADDFLEGVRALLIDKDNAPQWSPPRLDGVNDVMLDKVFAPLGKTDEWFPLLMIPA